MNVLDENFPVDQRDSLRQWRLHTRHIGFDLGHAGLKDEQIIPLLRRLPRPTLFTRDEDFYKRRRCDTGYALVFLVGDPDDLAEYVRRVLRHRELNTIRKRLGSVTRVSDAGLNVWRLHSAAREDLAW